MNLTALLFLAFFAGGSVLCIVRHPVWGLYTYVLVFYLDAPSRWWSVGLPDMRWSLTIVAITVIGTVSYKVRKEQGAKRQSFFSHAPHTLFILYVVWMYMQFLWAISPDHAEGVTYFTKYAIIMYLIYQLVDNQERAIGFLIAHIIGCFYLGTIAYSKAGGGRLDGVGGAGIDDSNNLGIYMATAVVAAGCLYLMARGRLKWLPILAMPFLLNTLVQSGSRGAFVALLGGCAVAYFYRPPGKTLRLWAYGVVGILLFSYLASDFFWDRMATIQDAAVQSEQADESALSRFQIIKDQWRMAKDYPIGTGHKGTAVLSYQYIDERFWSSGGGRSSHNTFMSVLVDQGFIGLLIWLAICWKLFQRCRGIAKWASHEADEQLGWLAVAVLGVTSVTWVGGIFTPFHKGEVFIWMIPIVCSLWSGSVGSATATTQHGTGST